MIQSVDNAVRFREDQVAGYTVMEHYALFRKHQEQQPAAEMTVKTTYRKAQGKDYAVVSESGPALLRKVLHAILDSEKKINEPGIRAGSLLDSHNYQMTIKGAESVNGQPCFALDLQPRRVSPYLIRGTLWVDQKTGAIVQLSGTTAKSATVFSGPSQVFRQYATIDGVAMATHARAVSDGWMVGETTLAIDYTQYAIQLQPGASGGSPGR